mgnify:CR=1 FL=1
MVYKTNCQGWLAEQAVDALNEGLKEFSDVKGIMCGNDDIASRWSIPLQKQDGREALQW